MTSIKLTLEQIEEVVKASLLEDYNDFLSYKHMSKEDDRDNKKIMIATIKVLNYYGVRIEKDEK